MCFLLGTLLALAARCYRPFGDAGGRRGDAVEHSPVKPVGPAIVTFGTRGEDHARRC